MTKSEQLMLLATENPSKGAFRLERPAPGVVAAITAGDGPSLNPKVTANEDSLAVVTLGSRTAALIADAHFGPAAGEIAARAFVRIMVRTPATRVHTQGKQSQTSTLAFRQASTTTG